jgi:prepilin-type N-terminal cleavage/methylation domain-containing protein
MSSVQNEQSGFSLIETVVAMGILATGLLGLLGVFTLGMAHMATSSANLVAREKAREAVESVHTARDTRVITWAQINNVSNGGVFKDNAQPMYKAGPDGLVGTDDDDDLGAAGLETQQLTAKDGSVLTVPMTNYTRTITITSVNKSDGTINPDLRQITVKVDYTVGPVKRSYTLTTLISSIS